MTAQTPQATEAATPKIQYRVTNWPDYDRALVEWGSLTIGFDEEFLQRHWRPAPPGKRGAPFRYSDEAIQALLGLKAVGRQQGSCAYSCFSTSGTIGQ